MLRKRLFLGCSVLLVIAAIGVAAQRQSNKPKAPQTTAAPKGAAPAPRSTAKATQAKPPVKTTQPPVKAPQAPAVNSQHALQGSAGGKELMAKASAPAPTSKLATPAKLEKPTDSKLAKAKAAPTATTPSTTLLTEVQQKLRQNANLASKVTSRLPQGTDLMGAAAGFNNLAQMVAAVNVSNNLQVSFTDLKAKLMTGMSLGQAIQAVRPLTASPTIEAQRAEYDASGLIASEQPPQAASSGPAPITTPTTTTTAMPQKSTAKVKNSVQ